MSSINNSVAFAQEIRKLARCRIHDLSQTQKHCILANAVYHEENVGIDDDHFGYHFYVEYPNGRKLSLLKSVSFYAAEKAHARGIKVIGVHGWSRGAYNNNWEVVELLHDEWAEHGTFSDDEVVEFCLAMKSRGRSVKVRKKSATKVVG